MPIEFREKENPPHPTTSDWLCVQRPGAATVLCHFHQTTIFSRVFLVMYKVPSWRQVWILYFIILSMISYGTVLACRASSRRVAFASGSIHGRSSAIKASFTRLSSTTKEAEHLPPWNRPMNSQRKKDTRVRQHVNPLARIYQQPTILSQDWPKDVLHDMSLPLHLDIGCGRGGFLLEMAAEVPHKNYLGLEIRPSIFQYALDRVEKRGLTGRLTFVGCNANVDLERILSLYQKQGGGPIDTVSIQFPDPHFKSQHAKRRVVTPSLVFGLAKFMPESSRLFLQSDIKEVLDDMRLRFREQDQYFHDEVEDVEEYLDENPMNIQTERERSVLARDLPVYRTMMRRTAAPVMDK
jgi:tRNA (guanine-N7-)-methyltransferase